MSIFHGLTVLGLLAVSGCGAAAAAQPWTQREVVAAAVPAPTAARPQAPALPPGCSRKAVACVSTAHRVAWLQHDGKVSYGPVPVSLGGPGHRTPTGTFRVAWKDAEHTSRTYGIDMPWSVFFAAGGVAFHEGPVDESSHGCVHLGPAAARRFFAELRRGDRVQVL